MPVITKVLPFRQLGWPNGFSCDQVHALELVCWSKHAALNTEIQQGGKGYACLQPQWEPPKAAAQSQNSLKSLALLRPHSDRAEQIITRAAGECSDVTPTVRGPTLV